MVRLYQTPEFRDFMWRSDWVRGVYLHSWLEQATKSRAPFQWFIGLDFIRMGERENGIG